ncbi:MAG: type I-E CRISPR-associated protein Cas6/Cse3/CasE [Gemmatimonadaceae bacterium]
MTESRFLSRVRVRRDAPIAALRDVLVPGDDSARYSAGHQLIWTLFADAPERDRDFLWREWEPGHFLVLSRRPPHDAHAIFHLDAPKPFHPSLRVGQRLRFSLRANATVAKKLVKGARGKPCDVVMDMLHALPPADRARERPRVAQEAATRWLTGQGERSGFVLEPAADHLQVMSYRQLQLRRRGATPARVGVLDLEGTLTITEPDRFLERMGAGFGRAKAFGCGLMLIMRA